MASKKIIPCDGQMFEPPHPGEVLKGLYLQPMKLTITVLAERLGVERKALSRLINGHHGVTAEMAVRLGKAFATTAEHWLALQDGYDLWRVRQSMRKEIARIRPLTQGLSL